MMNVLYLTLNPNRLSTTVPTEGWFRVLRDRGLQPVLISRELGAFHKWAVRERVPAYQDDLPFPDKKSPLRFLLSLWKLKRIVRRHHIQLIHCNEHDVYPFGWYLGKICRLPVVVSVHFTMERGFCRWAFAGWKQPERLIFTSRGNRDACLAGVEGVVPESRRRLLYNGVDLESLRPDDARRRSFRSNCVQDSDVLIGVACALRPRKQLEHIFEAAARINDRRLKVVVAGGPVAGDEKYARHLLLDAQRRLGDCLIQLGHLDDLRDFYNGLDLFVNASQEEACSLSVIEALACGCPVVGYPSKSVDDQILPGGGEICPQDDVDQLTAMLRRWIDDRELRGERRRCARRRAEAVFDIRKVSLQLWNEYQDILLPRHAPTRAGAASESN